MLWFWSFVGPAALLAALALRGERKRADYVTSRLTDLRIESSEVVRYPSKVVMLGPRSLKVAFRER